MRCIYNNKSVNYELVKIRKESGLLIVSYSETPFLSANNLHLSLIFFPLSLVSHFNRSLILLQTTECMPIIVSVRQCWKPLKIQFIQFYIRIQIIMNSLILNQSWESPKEKQVFHPPYHNFWSATFMFTPLA